MAKQRTKSTETERITSLEKRVDNDIAHQIERLKDNDIKLLGLFADMGQSMITMGQDIKKVCTALGKYKFPGF